MKFGVDDEDERVLRRESCKDEDVNVKGRRRERMRKKGNDIYIKEMLFKIEFVINVYI
jgi:hypothetical protein